MRQQGKSCMKCSWLSCSSHILFHLSLQHPECKWTGKLSELVAHHNTCPCENVLCPRGCRDIHLRRQEEAHHKVCPNRSVSCAFCNKEMKHCQMKEHLDMCGNKP